MFYRDPIYGTWRIRHHTQKGDMKLWTVTWINWQGGGNPTGIMPIEKSKGLPLKSDFLTKLKNEESVTGRHSCGRTQVQVYTCSWTWLTTLLWDVSSHSRGLLFVSGGLYQIRTIPYATTDLITDPPLGPEKLHSFFLRNLKSVSVA